MSRQLGVRRSRFQPFAAPVIAEPLQDCVVPKAHFTVSLGQRPRNEITPKKTASAESATHFRP
jgi:hypothetical protein